MFWRKLLYKFPAVYNRIECMSLEIALECFPNNIFVELKTVMFLYSIQGMNYYKW